MALPPKKDHRISAAEAATLTKAHRNANASGPNGHYFDRSAFDTILAQPGVSGIRIYHGQNADKSHALVLVGVDGAGADMTSGAIMEFGMPCPPWCDANSALQG
ncbi:MAG TPA: hypothetical protein VL295_04390 [Gemmatimonadales bacterium]|jgi:hypothetical protein|nr:hypothetical protein [Gemmatimonadales bacterium]